VVNHVKFYLYNSLITMQNMISLSDGAYRGSQEIFDPLVPRPLRIGAYLTRRNGPVSVCISNLVATSQQPQILGDAGLPTLSDGGVSNPEEHAIYHTSSRAEFDQTVWGLTNFGDAGPYPSYGGVPDTR